MPRTPTVVVHHDLPVADAIAAATDAVSVVDATARTDALAALSAADVFVVNPTNWTDEFLAGLEAGDWVQATSAGYAAFPVETFRERGIAFANAGDVHSVAVADHAMGMLLALARGLPTCVRNQDARRWDRSIGCRVVDLADRRLLVIGLGSIGERIARRALAFSMTVHGSKRDPTTYDGVLDAERVHDADGWRELLPRMDAVVLAVPLTDRTRGLFDANAFDRLPDHAIVVNVARGPVLDADALLAAMRDDRLGGAGLDVFEEEPLPTDAPLWDEERVIISPHVAGRSTSFVDRFVDHFVKNVECWRRNDPLGGEIVGGNRTA